MKAQNQVQNNTIAKLAVGKRKQDKVLRPTFNTYNAVGKCKQDAKRADFPTGVYTDVHERGTT